MKMGTRSKMVAGAIDLIRRRGVNATSVREVVRHTDTPRGSIRHHFPSGKLQLVEEAVILAGKEVSQALEKLMANKGAVAGLSAFVGLWRHSLESSNFEAGCPVLSVAVEQYIGEDGNPQPEAEQRLLELADTIFKEWQSILEASLLKDGVSPERAKRLANLIVSSVEGTVPMCRAARSTTPLDDVRSELEMALAAAIPQTAKR
jgi:AcrR family transcriptional regulator